ncbi:hypothetical protein DFA_07651 [Cavenderia fasciculata]|uniref:HAT C-terminal dimerisation domain-containing protein n=1 Tax=Cavenderia fasciculata TaxID=261658 RepID=F4Q2J4_CACFS|nr:uncharacterized protein DFA_07651 [Cavenderia fasciculata]EGG16673.1 hypothetical protein DFA_07651 [Cavenderia fasciculata]|eukprot:XP_004355147.1 hypothetical protein DFA_07651 [Cavenderia fasciculata]
MNSQERVDFQLEHLNQSKFKDHYTPIPCNDHSQGKNVDMLYKCVVCNEIRNGTTPKNLVHNCQVASDQPSTKKEFYNSLSKFIIQNNLAFHVVDGDSLWILLDVVNRYIGGTNGLRITSVTMKTKINEIYSDTKTHISELVKNLHNITITLDGWEANNNDRFLGITVHGLLFDMTQKAHRFYATLGCNHFTSNHTAVNTVEKIKQVVKEFNLDLTKVDMVVTDNASVMNKTRELLIADFPQAKHQGCLAHSHQLIVGEFLKLKQVEDIKSIYSGISKHFKHSGLAYESLWGMTKEDEPLVRFPKPTVVRWGSWYDNLEKLKKSIPSLNRYIQKKQLEPTKSQGLVIITPAIETQIDLILGQLKTAREITTQIQGRSISVSDALPFLKRLEDNGRDFKDRPDPLDWWNDQKNANWVEPLKEYALYVLALCCTSVESERLFSFGGKIVNKSRSSLSPSATHQLSLCKSNQHLCIYDQFIHNKPP